jgi:hypothetical protein
VPLNPSTAGLVDLTQCELARISHTHNHAVERAPVRAPRERHRQFGGIPLSLHQSE